ncbi:hypothetical protein K443DRAFT_9176 [Laccaria amethystina LaAM-08-1]|uniref:Uncharacterized protein n=1 Tax=Laccaria amethystina LaAM-08-1 TaxID=1095629 RepID=A0A0C9WMS3_9AGAR|nr:hypothetical protein K443DRAFT_9176 [Laccaria amethystina LaAM-08-1]
MALLVIQRQSTAQAHLKDHEELCTLGRRRMTELGSSDAGFRMMFGVASLPVPRSGATTEREAGLREAKDQSSTTSCRRRSVLSTNLPQRRQRSFLNGETSDEKHLASLRSTLSVRLSLDEGKSLAQTELNDDDELLIHGSCNGP